MANKKLWRWRGVSPQGQPMHGALWSTDKALAMQDIQREGIIPLSLKRDAVKASLWRSQHCSDLMQQLATLLQAGLTLSEGLTLLSEQHPSAQWQALLQDMAVRLAQGSPLSEAMSEWPEVFPPLYPATIRAGEMTGRLEHCCFHLARQQQAQQRLAQKVAKALRYPLVVILLAVAVIIGMCGFVLPEFAQIYRTFNTPLPTLTRMVMALSVWVERAFPLLAGLILSPLLLRPLMRRSGRWPWWKAAILRRIPVLAALRRGQMLSHIFMVLALSQRAGVPFLQGLESVETTLSCPWWRHVIRQIHDAVAQGKPIWQAFEDSGAFTPLCRQLIRTGETSGALDAMLENLAHYYDEQTHHLADNLAALLEPVLLAVTGGIIGTLVVAMYLPVFHLGDAISGAGMG
ncbi:protein transport protein HofC [[Enterobacter] lignolyticus]|nr:protein transport protein HofC [[Enterobacter] lignolyticus]